MRLLSMAAATVGLLAVGCGGGGGKTPSGGSNTPPLGNNSGATFVPANAAKSVGLDQVITINFSQPIDPATVSETTVKLIPVMDQSHMAMRLGGTEDAVEQVMENVIGPRVLNTAGQQVTVTPTEHLEYGMTYRIELSGLKAKTGTALPAATSTFNTLVNPRTKRLTYSNTGVLERTHIYEVNTATGMTSEMRSYLGSDTNVAPESRTVMMNATIPGPGGAAPPIPVFEVEYVGATATIKEYEAAIKEGTSIVAFGDYDGPGANLVWDQVDDVLDGYFTMSPEHGNHFVTSRFSAAGNISAPWSDRNDPTKFTARGIEMTERDAMGRTLGQYIYSSIGTDGIDVDSNGKPSPGNDVLIQYTKIERDTRTGERVKSFRFGRRAGRDPVAQPAVAPAGLDGVLFTTDDPITEYEFTELDAMGHEVLEVEYKSPGAITPPSVTGTRADWESTGDNLVDEYTVTTYTSGVRVSEKEYDAGADGIKGNADDILREETTFDPAL